MYKYPEIIIIFISFYAVKEYIYIELIHFIHDVVIHNERRIQ